MGCCPCIPGSGHKDSDCVGSPGASPWGQYPATGLLQPKLSSCGARPGQDTKDFNRWRAKPCQACAVFLIPVELMTLSLAKAI